MANPYTPVITTPVTGSSVSATPSSIGWTYNHPEPAKTQTHIQIRRKLLPSGSFEYANTGAATWGGSPVDNANTGLSSGGLGSSGWWTIGSKYQLAVRVKDSSGNYSAWSTDVMIRVDSAATLTLTTPAASPINDATQTFKWSISQAEGIPQQSYRVRVWLSASYGSGDGPTLLDSGVIYTSTVFQHRFTSYHFQTGATQYVVSVNVTLENGLSYTATLNPFVATYTEPAAPTATFTVNDATGAVDFVITDTPGTASGVLIQRSEDAGVTWSYVQGYHPTNFTDANLSSPTRWSHSDRFAPIGQIERLRYRAFRKTGFSQPFQVSQPASTTMGVGLLGNGWWLRDPLDAYNDVELQQVDFSSQFSVDGEVLKPEGRSEAVVIHQRTPMSERFQINTYVSTEADLNKVLNLLRSKKTIFVQGVSGAHQRWWVRIVGDVSYTQIMAKGNSNTNRFRHLFQVSGPAIEVAPVGFIDYDWNVDVTPNRYIGRYV